MKKTLTLGFLLVTIAVFGQEYGFDIHNTSLNEYLAIEDKLNSERIPNIRNHVSLNGNAQPIKFKRKERIISDLVVYYYFKEKDSTMSHILYEWDESLQSLKQNTNNKKSKTYQKALIRKFSELEKMITDIYGTPETRGDLSDLKKANKKGGLNKNVKWFPNDSTEIEMYATVSNFYEKRGMVTTAPTHRIRLYIRNTKRDKKVTSNLDKKRIYTLNDISVKFIKFLEKQDLIKAKRYLSDLIKEQVTEEQLILLSKEIDFNREIELLYRGVQMGLNGSAFTILQYKYADDQKSPPQEMIKVIFDEKNTIVGIQPLKMQH